MVTKIIKIYDCSEQLSYSPTMFCLKKYASDFSCQFIHESSTADVIITKDSFREDLIGSVKPLIKLMGGMEYLDDRIVNNNIHLKTITKAHHVIFSSDYAKRQFQVICGNLVLDKLKYSIILPAADPALFKQKRPIPHDGTTSWITIADDWNKPEHRLLETLNFAARLNSHFYMVGRKSVRNMYPKNVTTHDFAIFDRIPDLLSSRTAYVTFSHRESSADFLSMAVAARLPIFYADSGIAKEIVGSQGVGIPDASYAYQGYIPLNINNVICKDAYMAFSSNFKQMSRYALQRDHKARFEEMLFKYFRVIHEEYELAQARHTTHEEVFPF